MLVFIFAVGFLVGCVVGVVARRRKPIGSLRVDASDPDDGPYLFLELTKPVSDVSKRKRVTLTVDTDDYLPRK